MSGDTKKASEAIAKQRTGVRMTKQRLSQVTGFSVSWIEKLIAKGAPVYNKGRSGVPQQIDSAEFIGWLIAHERDKAESKYADIIKRLRAETGQSNGTDDADSAAMMTDDEAKKRLNLAKAKMAEIDLRKRQGEVVEIRTVTTLLERIIGACRARLLSVPKKISPVVAAEKDVNKTSVIIEDAIHEGLNELSRLDPADFVERVS